MVSDNRHAGQQYIIDDLIHKTTILLAPNNTNQA